MLRDTRTTSGPSRDLTKPARYFDGLAGTYAAYRPTYPRSAIRAMLEELRVPPRVADVGCGTGISSRLLLDAGAIVTGIDPSADMLAEAERGIEPGCACTFRIGAGEATGLEDTSVDLVLCAQSFHWLDAGTALDEFHRILVPRGRLALMWNIRSTDDAVATRYQAIVERAQADADTRGLLTRRIRSYPIDDDRFENLRALAFDNPHVLDWPGLLGRLHSASYYPVVGSPLRAELDAALRALFDEHAIDGQVTIGQTAELTLAERA
jgi:SAM-dependent methyltransferase